MTTAHRATWKAMRGGLQEDGSFRLHVPSAATSSKDAPTEQTLKTRARPHADVADADRAALRASLEAAEKGGPAPDTADVPVLPPPSKRPRSRFAPAAAVAAPPSPDRAAASAADEQPRADADADEPRDRDRDREDQIAAADAAAGNITRRPRAGDDSDSHSDSDSDSDSDSSDDEAELLAEVERLRQERANAAEEAAAAVADREESIRERAAAAGNPLLGDLNTGAAAVAGEDVSDTASLAGSEMTGSVATGASVAYAVRRRWDDDVVFRAQAGSDRATRPRFLNDTTRNDFHRRFMRKYMR